MLSTTLATMALGGLASTGVVAGFTTLGTLAFGTFARTRNTLRAITGFGAFARTRNTLCAITGFGFATLGTKALAAFVALCAAVALASFGAGTIALGTFAARTLGTIAAAAAFPVVSIRRRRRPYLRGRRTTTLSSYIRNL